MGLSRRGEHKAWRQHRIHAGPHAHHHRRAGPESSWGLFWEIGLITPISQCCSLAGQFDVCAMATEAKMEVTGIPEGTTLLEAIEGGTISQPTLMEFQAFQSWRKETGGRPTTAQDGAYTSSTTESRIWKEVMAHFYGKDWHALLSAAKARRAGDISAAESAADAASVIDGSDGNLMEGMGTPGLPSIITAAGVPVGESSEEAETAPRSSEVIKTSTSPVGARRLFDQGFDPASESVEEYMQKLRRIICLR